MAHFPANRCHTSSRVHGFHLFLPNPNIYSNQIRVPYSDALNLNRRIYGIRKGNV